MGNSDLKAFFLSMGCTWLLSFFLLMIITGQVGTVRAEAPALKPPKHNQQPVFTLPSKPMHSDLPADTIIRRHNDNGTITFLRSANLSAALEQDSDFRALQAEKRYGEMALMFLTQHAELFKLKQPAQEFAVQSVDTDHLGFTHVRLHQQFAGIPVWGADLIAHVNRTQQLYLIQGRYLPTPETAATSPALSVDEALQAAAQALGHAPSECPQCEAKLMIFAAAYQPPQLSYRVLASKSITEKWALMIDAINGTVLEKRSTISTSNPFRKN